MISDLLLIAYSSTSICANAICLLPSFSSAFYVFDGDNVVEAPYLLVLCVRPVLFFSFNHNRRLKALMYFQRPLTKLLLILSFLLERISMFLKFITVILIKPMQF